MRTINNNETRTTHLRKSTLRINSNNQGEPMKRIYILTKGVPMNTKHQFNPQGVHMKTVQPLDKKTSQGAPMFLSSLLNNVLGWLINCFMVVKNHFKPTSAIQTTENSIESGVEALPCAARKVRKDKGIKRGPYGSSKNKRTQAVLPSEEPSPGLDIPYSILQYQKCTIKKVTVWKCSPKCPHIRREHFRRLPNGKVIVIRESYIHGGIHKHKKEPLAPLPHTSTPQVTVAANTIVTVSKEVVA